MQGTAGTIAREVTPPHVLQGLPSSGLLVEAPTVGCSGHACCSQAVVGPHVAGLFCSKLSWSLVLSARTCSALHGAAAFLSVWACNCGPGQWGQSSSLYCSARCLDLPALLCNVHVLNALLCMLGSLNTFLPLQWAAHAAMMMRRVAPMMTGPPGQTRPTTGARTASLWPARAAIRRGALVVATSGEGAHHHRSCFQHS